MASITDDNFLVMNQGKNPLVNFNFMLRVEMIYDLPCKSVRAFSRELEYDFIQEGGLNDYVHMRRKPISKPFTLEIERYVGVDYIDPLPLGADLVLPVMLFVSRAHSQFIPGVVARTYTFTGCTVMKKTYGDLVADQSGLLVETTTIGYREMVCTDIPWSEAGDNIFASTKTVPINASSLDKSAEDFRMLGQTLYDQALEAKLRSDEAFVPADLDGLLQELETAAGQLRTDTAPGGRLPVAVEEAEEALAGTDGKSLREVADASRMVARDKEAAAKATEQVWQEKNEAYQKAQSEADLLQDQLSELTARSADLTAQLERDREEETAIKDWLAEKGVSSSTDAQQALIAAQTAFDAAQSAVEEAQKALDDARQELGDQLDLATAKRESAETAVPNAEKREADAKAAVEQAEEALKQAEEALKTTEEEVQSAQEKVDSARLNITAAEESVAAAEESLSNATPEEAAAARKDLEDAQARQAEAEQALQAAQKVADAAAVAITVAATALENATDETRDILEEYLANRQAEAAQAETALEQAQKDLEQTQASVTQAQEALNAVTSETMSSAQQELESKQQVRESTQAAGAEAEAELAAAQEKRAEAQKEVQSARNALDEAKKAAETAAAGVEDSKNTLNEATAEAKALQESLNHPAEGSKLDELQAEIDAASEERNAAQAKVDEAELCVQEYDRLMVLSGSIKETESKAKEAEASLAAVSGQKTAADQAAATAKSAADTQKAAHDTALAAWNEANAKAEKDLAAEETAVRNLSEANTRLSSATRSVRALQNHLTNLRSRKETVNQSQTDCTAQHDLCKTANDTLQGMPDDPLMLVNNQYETVKKLSKQTVYHSRQVLETVQHMASARESLEEAALLLPQAEAVGG